MASMEKKIMSQEAHAESLADLSASKRETLDDQFQALSSGGAVADKLAALKAKVAQPSA
jgi:phage shock protein A